MDGVKLFEISKPGTPGLLRTISSLIKRLILIIHWFVKNGIYITINFDLHSDKMPNYTFLYLIMPLFYQKTLSITRFNSFVVKAVYI